MNEPARRDMSINDVRNVLEARCPGLHGRIETMLIEAEAGYNRQTGQASSEFLLEHTRRTAAIAHKICRLEGVDPFLPLAVALFHDAGKFHEGEYHKDDIPEEEHAAVLAESMLAEFGVERGDIDAVRDALRALYNDKLPCVGACRIVQDADRLDKLGALGVSAFFTKAALRGRGLVDALTQTASRELTYALAAPRAMFTETGKKLATAQAAKSVAFFDGLLRGPGGLGHRFVRTPHHPLAGGIPHARRRLCAEHGGDGRHAAHLPGLRGLARADASPRTGGKVREAHRPFCLR